MRRPSLAASRAPPNSAAPPSAVHAIPTTRTIVRRVVPAASHSPLVACHPWSRDPTSLHIDANAASYVPSSSDAPAWHREVEHRGGLPVGPPVEPSQRHVLAAALDLDVASDRRVDEPRDLVLVFDALREHDASHRRAQRARAARRRSSPWRPARSGPRGGTALRPQPCHLSSPRTPASAGPPIATRSRTAPSDGDRRRHRGEQRDRASEHGGEQEAGTVIGRRRGRWRGGGSGVEQLTHGALDRDAAPIAHPIDLGCHVTGLDVAAARTPGATPPRRRSNEHQ